MRGAVLKGNVNLLFLELAFKLTRKRQKGKIKAINKGFT